MFRLSKSALAVAIWGGGAGFSHETKNCARVIGQFAGTDTWFKRGETFYQFGRQNIRAGAIIDSFRLRRSHTSLYYFNGHEVYEFEVLRTTPCTVTAKCTDHFLVLDSTMKKQTFVVKKSFEKTFRLKKDSTWPAQELPIELEEQIENNVWEVVDFERISYSNKQFRISTRRSLYKRRISKYSRIANIIVCSED